MDMQILALGSTTVVTATVTDSDGQTWNNGSFTMTLFNALRPGDPILSGNVVLTQQQRTVSGSISATGVITATLFDVAQVSPAGSVYQVSLTPNVSIPAVSAPSISPTGTTQDLSSIVSAGLQGPRITANFNAFAYGDANLLIPEEPGAVYFNVTTNVQRIWNGTTWVNNGGGGGGGVSQIVAGTNVTIVPTTGVGAVTINSSGTGSSAWSAITAGANAQTGAFSSAGPWTFSAAGGIQAVGGFFVASGSGFGNFSSFPTVVIGGSPIMDWNTTGMRLQSAFQLGWEAGAGVSGAPDVILSRSAVGILQIGGSAAGNTGQLNLGVMQLIGGTPAASTSQLLCTTAPYTAGTASTNVPVAYLDSGAVEPTSWSVNGTILGENAPAGFIGDFIDCRVNGGTSAFSVFNAANGTSLSLGSVSGTITLQNSSGQLNLNLGATTVLNYASGFFRFASTQMLGWTASATGAAALDVNFTRASAGVVQIGTGQTFNNTGTLNLANLQLIGGTPAASQSQLLCNTAPYSAGTGTTNSPVVYYDSGAVEPTTWNTNGTIEGMNAPSGFTGNFIDCRVNGAASTFSVSPASTTGSVLTLGGSSPITLTNQLGQYFQLTIGSTMSHVLSAVQTRLNSTNVIGWTASATSANSNPDITIGRAGIGILQVNAGTGAGSTGSLKLAHLLGGSATPTLAPGNGAGTAPTISLATGSTDIAGQLLITTGTAPVGLNAVVAVLTLSSAVFANNPFVTLTPANAAAAALTAATQVYPLAASSSSFQLICGNTGLAASTAYVWNYQVIGS